LTYRTLVIGGGVTLKQLGWFVVTSFFFRRVHFRIFFSKAFFFAFWSGSLVTWLTTMERSWFFKSIQNKNNIMFYLLKINILVRKYLCALTVQWALYCGLLMHISSKESLPNAEQFLLNRFSRNHCQYWIKH
jgi:hypothetical protein